MAWRSAQASAARRATKRRCWRRVRMVAGRLDGRQEMRLVGAISRAAVLFCKRKVRTNGSDMRTLAAEPCVW